MDYFIQLLWDNNLKILVVGSSLFFGTLTHAQTNTDTIQAVINQTVWKPFQAAFEKLDAKALNDTYADQVLRVTPQKIDTQGSFKKANIQRFNQYKAVGTKINLDFWFDSRHTNATTSYEVGFYRILATDPNGKSNSSHGQFHIVLKLINGEWKITQDWDTATIGSEEITAEDFARKKPQSF